MTETRLGNIPNVEFGLGMAETTVRARYNRQLKREQTSTASTGIRSSFKISFRDIKE